MNDGTMDLRAAIVDLEVNYARATLCALPHQLVRARKVIAAALLVVRSENPAPEKVALATRLVKDTSFALAATRALVDDPFLNVFYEDFVYM